MWEISWHRDTEKIHGDFKSTFNNTAVKEISQNTSAAKCHTYRKNVGVLNIKLL